MTFRILITGSRTWEDRQAIRDALRSVWREAGSPQDAVLVSGASPKGADRMCEEVWAFNGLAVERHPAAWRTHDEQCPESHRGQDTCKRAGFRRNAEMVALGADVCIGFIRDGSAGATSTVNLAQRAGIRTVVCEA
ncbi:MAG: DUF2493 domain-containing protein [Microbacterium sp.]|uniref:SLOG family protein n=1 Tax=Microbacterium sp. TaxID=51671 RepID=UPI001ACDEA33|nr:SLOG family protein [Microbacterium sp.]MBN9214747.1 DUF2493 domain-containing protein [Microbacterium sp.]